MNRNVIVGLVALVVAGLGVGYFILQGTPGGSAGSVASADGATATAQDDFRFSFSEFPEFQPVLQPANRDEFLTPHWTDTAFGDPQAPVTIIEFFSYACPHCKSFHEGSYQRILIDYVETGQVQFIKRDFILGGAAAGVGFELLAGAGSQCFVEDAQKQAFADLVFEQQRSLTRASNPTEALVPVYEAAGMEGSMARACMTDQKNRSLVFGRSFRASNSGWVSGTPTVFINGERYIGNTNDYADLSRTIEQAIQAAR